MKKYHQYKSVIYIQIGEEGENIKMKKKMQYNKYIDVLFMLCIFLSIFKPAGLTKFVYINNFLKIIKGIALIYMTTKIIKNRKIKNYAFLVYYIIFGSIYIINSVIYDTEYFDTLNNFYSNLILMCYIHLEMNLNKRNLLNNLSLLFKIIIILQIISMIVIYTFKLDIFGNESGIKYFLGLDNYSAFVIIPMISVIFFRDELFEKEISNQNIILLALLNVCYFYTESVTAFIALFILLFCIICLKNKKNILKYFSIRRIAILIAISTIMIITMNFQNLFSYLLENIMKKGITLNSRTIIWERTIDLIKNKPILGWGELSTIDIKNYVLYGAEHAHNVFLELLLRTGIIGTLAYITFIDKAVSNVYKKENTKNEISILLIGIIAFEIISFMDCYLMMPYQYIVIAILYYYNDDNMDFERKIIRNARKFFKRKSAQN